MGMVADANLGLEKILKKGNAMLAPGGAIQLFIDSTVLKEIAPYVPRRNGTLTKSAILHSKIGQGKLIWKTPYARYLYHGVLYVDPLYKIGGFTDGERFWSRPGVAKVPSNPVRRLAFDTSRSARAGAKWCERYKDDHLRELAGMVQGKAASVWKNS